MQFSWNQEQKIPPEEPRELLGPKDNGDAHREEPLSCLVQGVFTVKMSPRQHTSIGISFIKKKTISRPNQLWTSMESFVQVTAKVAKIRAWIPIVNNPRNITGIGTSKDTKETWIITTNSSANTFLKSQKLRDKGYVKSSRTFNMSKYCS